MARVLAPLLSLNARQTFGKTLTYANWKGISTVRLKSNPTNPKTVTQMTNRARFSAGGKIAKALSAIGTLATYLRTVTPAQQSYVSYLVGQSMGVGNATVIAALAAYNLSANATIKGFFDAQAIVGLVQAVDIGPASYERIAAGGVLAIGYFGAQASGSASATTAFDVLTSAQVITFRTALTNI